MNYRHTKKISFLAFALVSVFLYSQYHYGVKGGINVGDVGDFSPKEAPGKLENNTALVGFNFGVYGEAILKKFSVRPELYYTRLNSEYGTRPFSLNKLDLPILFGYRVLKAFTIYLGPSAQYIISANLDKTSASDIESKLSLNGQAGLRLDIWRIGIDARYEAGVLPNNGNVGGSSVNLRPSQFLLGISLRIR